MSVRRQVELICDQCLDGQDEAFWLVEEARIAAKRDGWQRRGKLDFCPICVADAWERAGQ